MRFEKKILLLFAVVIVIWMIAVNAIIFTFFKYEELQRLKSDSELYLYMKRYNKNFRAPSFVIVSKKPVHAKGFELFEKRYDYYVYFEKGYMHARLSRFLIAVVVWEISLAVILILMAHIVLKHFINKERSYREFLRFLLGAISHKMGNFLSIQKLNLELIKTEDERPLNRLKEAYRFMEKDFREILNVIKEAETEEIQSFDVKEVINGALDALKGRMGEREVDIDIEKLHVSSKNGDFVNVVHELLENALKYSERFIRIKAYKRDKYVRLVIENDIKHRPGGSGFGIELVKYLARRNGWHLSVDREGTSHRVTLIMRT